MGALATRIARSPGLARLGVIVILLLIWEASARWYLLKIPPNAPPA